MEKPPQDFAVTKKQLDSVTQWLRSRGMQDSLITEINTKYDEDTQPKAPEDPWANLQSTRDKLKNVENQLAKATEDHTALQEKMDASSANLQQLEEKRTELMRNMDRYREIVADSSLQQKAQEFEELLTKIQTKVAEGIPQEGSSERRELYELIFGTKPANAPSHEGHNGPFDEVSHADFASPGATPQQEPPVDGKGFGPTGKGGTSSCATGPYSPADSVPDGGFQKGPLNSAR